MDKETQAHEDLELARLYCWLIALLYPGWALAIAYFLPQSYNDLAGRSAFGLAFLVVGGLSYVSDFIRTHLAKINFVGYNLVAIHWYFLVFYSGLDPIYIMGSLVMAFGFNLAFVRIKGLLVYSVVLIVCAVMAATLASADITQKFMLVMGITTSQLIGITFVVIRSKITRNLVSANLRSVALQQELTNKELEAAQVIQKHLLANPPEIPEIEFSSYYCSAGMTGGDWFGHYYDKKHQFLYLWVGDVTGHGFPSALVTAVACGTLYAGEKRVDLENIDSSPENRIELSARVVNEVIYEKGGKLLMTMLFCGLNVKTGELFVGNAGHRFPYIIGRDHKSKQVTVNGNILGLDPKLKLDIRKFQLNDGDTVFMYTDGLLENRSPADTVLNRIHLKKAMESAPTPSLIMDHVVKMAEQHWSGKDIDDDVTIVRLTWTAS